MNHQILQLQPPIPVVTPMGDAIAHLVIDYSIEHSIHWVVFMEDTGQCWTLPNEKIRAQRNITLGRMNPEKPEQISLKDLLKEEDAFFSETDEDIESPS